MKLQMDTGSRIEIVTDKGTSHFVLAIASTDGCSLGQIYVERDIDLSGSVPALVTSVVVTAKDGTRTKTVVDRAVLKEGR